MAKRKSKKTTITIPESEIWNTILDEKAQRDKLKKEEEKQAAKEERKRLREEIKAELKERKRLEREAKKAAKKKKPVEEVIEEPKEEVVEEIPEDETPMEFVQPVINEIKVIEVQPDLESNVRINVYKFIARIASALLLVFLLLYFYDSNKTLSYVMNSNVSYQFYTIDNNTSLISEFNYNEVYQEPKKVNYQYYIESIITTNDNNETYKKEEMLFSTEKYTNNSKVVSISEGVTIPISKYNEYAKRFDQAKSELVVSLVLVKDNKKEVVSSLKMTLLDDKYNIEKEVINNKSDNYKVELNIWIRFALLSTIIFLLEFALYTTIKMILFVLKHALKSDK